MKYNYCTACNKTVERIILDTALRAICPQCGAALSIIETEMKAGLSLEHSVLALIVGFVGYKILKDLFG